MASVSFQIPIGKGDDLGVAEVTKGVAAPTTASNIEVRVDVTTTPTTRKEIVQALGLIIRRIEDQGGLFTDFPNI